MSGLRRMQSCEFAIRVRKSINAKIIGVEWHRNRLSVVLFSAEPGKLVFAENIYPGRHANVNHAASPVKADGIFMSVDIPAGTDTDKQSRN